MPIKRALAALLVCALGLGALACAAPAAPPPAPTAAPAAAPKAAPTAAPAAAPTAAPKAAPTSAPAAAPKPTAKEEKVTVRFGYLKANYSDVPALLAMYEKYFEREGLTMQYVPFSVGRDAVQALVGGALDVSVVGPVPFVSAVGKKSEERFFSPGVTEYYGNGQSVVVRKDLDAKTPADLKGKKIGMYVGSTTHSIMINKVFPENGLQPTDYQVVNMDLNQLVSALAVGGIDAFAGSDPQPIRAELSGVGRIILNLGKYDPTPMMYGASRAFAKSYPESMTKFMIAAARGVKLWQDDLPRASKIMQELVGEGGTKLAPEEADQLIKRVEPSPFFMPKMAEYLEDIAQSQLKAGTIDVMPKWDTLLVTEYYDRAAAVVGLKNPFK